MPATKVIEFERFDAAQMVFGHREGNLKELEAALTIDIHTRGTRVTLTGDPVDIDVAARVLNELYALACSGQPLETRDVARVVDMVRERPDQAIGEVFNDVILKHAGKTIRPRTAAQKTYVDAIRAQDVVFGIGPAGTGKTYLAVAMAVAALQAKKVRRIILTRPAVEAGEKLGFLPGDLQEKVSPYLRPLYDSMQEMMDPLRLAELTERGVIEVAPLAFMRGRTLNDAFVILDEAQNTTEAQMKMFLTRIGFNSRAVITGDLSQIDLGRGIGSGLRQATRILAGIPGIAATHFTEVDVVRHPLVRRIIAAYERDDEEAASRRHPQRDTSLEGES